VCVYACTHVHAYICVINIYSNEDQRKKSLAVPSDEIRLSLADWKPLFSKADADAHAAGAAPPRPKSLGMSVVTLTSTLLTREMRRDPEFPNVRRGLLVTGVSDGSPAATAGVRPGDVVTLLNNRQISRTSQLETHMRARALWEAGASSSSSSSSSSSPSFKAIGVGPLRLGVVRKTDGEAAIAEIDLASR